MEKGWLTLGEVAQLLGVHPSTVRNWADSGKIPVHRTQGGHRRFRYQEIMLWLEAQKGDGVANHAEHLIQEVLKSIRWRVAEGSLQGQTWYEKLDAEAREAYRRSGRSLIHALQTYLSGNDEEGLAEARSLGYEYATRGRQFGLSLEEATQAFLFFRNNVVEVLLESLEASALSAPHVWSTLMRRVMRFTDAVLSTLIEIYEALRRREEASLQN